MDNKVRRIGVLAPPGNVAMERELPLFLPPGVVMNHKRLSRPGNAISLIDLLDCIASLRGSRPRCEQQDWRTGDQRYFVADSRRFQQATGWKPRVGAYEGIERLYQWLLAQRGLAPDRRRARVDAMVVDAAASMAS